MGILFNSLKENPRPLFVANPDLVAPHEEKFSIEPAYYVSHLVKNGIHLPFWLGKPFPTIFELAMNRINELSGRFIPLSKIGMVGDTLHTDILGANSFGLKSILMGFGLDSDAIHSPNEHYGVFNFLKGIETIPLFFKYFHELKSKK